MSKNLPVIAVIPNYNMAGSLKDLLPEVLEQNYDAVYVLDDASTDRSEEIVWSFGTKVRFVAGNRNVGSGGNRNRIMDVLDEEAIIHFIDADMRLKTRGIPAIARKLMDEPRLGFVGGLVYGPDGAQMEFNYGPRLCLRNDLSVPLDVAALVIGSLSPPTEQWLRSNIKILRAWPNPRSTPERRQVFWASEANMLIRSSTFKKLGGYDPGLRDHDILDLSIRAQALGLKSYFDPSFAALHTAVQVRSGLRSWSRVKSEAYIVRKHGLKHWLSWSRRLEPKEQFVLADH